MNPNPFKLALLQMLVKGGDLAWNLTHAVDLIAEAASHGADMALLPECMDLGWTHPSSLSLAGEIPGGEACRRLCDAARTNKIMVCAGLTEKDGDKIYNSAVIIDKQGAVLCKHRKLNELDIGHAFYAQGDRLNAVETEFGRFGLMICADATAKDHVLARALGYMGVDLILSPSAWAVPPDHDNTLEPYGGLWRDAYMPVAREFALTIASASSVGSLSDGPWKGWICIGSSLVTGPDGIEIFQGPYGKDAETIVYLILNLQSRPARGTDWDRFWKIGPDTAHEMKDANDNESSHT